MSGAAQRYIEIVRMLARRQFVGRYRGSVLGVLTAVIVPIAFLLGYTFVFSTLIPIRLRPEASRADYAFFFFAGLLGWTLFAETVARAPRLFSDQAHFVRKALFPVSALPLSAALTAFYHSLIWFAVFVTLRLVMEGSLPVTVALAPPLLVLLCLLTAGIALIVASLGAFVRDLSELVGPILTVGLFVSPVLYPSERIADVAPWLVHLNPLAPLIESLRVSLLGTVPDLPILTASLAWSLGLLAAGVLVHRRLSPALADVL